MPLDWKWRGPPFGTATHSKTHPPAANWSDVNRDSCFLALDETHISQEG